MVSSDFDAHVQAMRGQIDTVLLLIDESYGAPAGALRLRMASEIHPASSMPGAFNSTAS
jgi:hypothetical protein